MRWFPVTGGTLRADLVAGITVALILVPQSMAYAQLAGLPVVYGLYASFVPVIVASLWGSSNQLHTGPVAMLSLMSAAALMSFATPGTTDFIQLSLMLALLVGILRLLLGIFRLNLLSSPVIIGFTNAAALIIGLSQLNKVIGVPFPRTDSYLSDLWQVLAQIPQLHWWTLAFAAGAWLLIAGLRKVSTSIPSVLIAVVTATLLSAVIGYEDKLTISTSSIADQRVAQTISAYEKTNDQINKLTALIADNIKNAKILEESDTLKNLESAQSLRAQANVHRYQLERLEKENNARRIELHSIKLYSIDNNAGTISSNITDANHVASSHLHQI